MLFLFLLFFFLWLLSVAYRMVLTVIPFTYFGGTARAYWGLRYFQEHLIIEAVVVVSLGIAVGLTVHYARNSKQYIASVFGFAALPLLVLMHFATLNWEIGYQERALIAGKLHVVDWRYSPYVSGSVPGEQALHVQVSIPGFNAIYYERPEKHLTLRLAKSDSLNLVYSSIFTSDPDTLKASECVEEMNNRYCRIFIEGAWYFAHHHNREAQSDLFPTLEELERELPNLFEGFVGHKQTEP